MNDFSIGILGGMGTYATIKLFQQYAEMFPAKKEWERPRIIIDNNCTMPSRVRAVLYGEQREELVKRMTSSIELLLSADVNRIVLACNTSHLFLPDVYSVLPEAKERVVDIIDACVEELVNRKISAVYLMASEGTIVSKVYQKKLSEAGIQCKTPSEREFSNLRLCIEAVKQNVYDSEVKNIFINYVNANDNCILGCTELPVLYDLYSDEITSKNIYNPLEIALNEIYKEFMMYNGKR